MARTCVRWLATLVLAALPGWAAAQPLGTFRWQLQPYCNVVTVSVTQNGGVYRLEGTDDRCGAAQAGSVIGTAFLNPDGSIGLGLNIVSAPAGQDVPVWASISLPALGGTWRDGSGATGAFVHTPGPGTGGSPRPIPASGPLVPPVIRFQSDGGFLAGRAPGVGAIPAEGAGSRMMWHAGKAAFRAGQVTSTRWDDASVGNYSMALGLDALADGLAAVAVGAGSRASAQGSTAMGWATLASASYSTATGYSTTASGDAAASLGSGSVASGPASVAMGAATTASGAASTALGRSTQAIGQDSLALGTSTSATGTRTVALGDRTVAGGTNSLAGGVLSQATGHESIAFGLRAAAGGNGSVVLGSDAVSLAAASGTFVFADRSTTAGFIGYAPNEFLVRAAGGVGFYTHAGLTTGLRLAPGGSQWLGVSDADTKHRFRDIDGEHVLARIARMPVTEWSYKAQDDAIRHIGPTAQDFHAAFGLGEDPLRIGTMDADGVALAAVKALEARTHALGNENAALRAAVEELRREVRELKAAGRD